MINRVNLIQIERQDPGFEAGTPGTFRFYLSHGKKPRDVQLSSIDFSPLLLSFLLFFPFFFFSLFSLTRARETSI